MLGNVSPQSVKIDSSAVVYPGRDHVTALNVKRFDGSKYVAADVSLLTRVVLAFPQLTPTVVFDSSITAGVFTWSGSTITVDLSDFSMPSSIQQSYLIVYDAEHPSGQVLVDDNSSVLEWDFRNISATGIVQPPVIELVGEAPADGATYGRKNGTWVSIDEVVAGVTSVNGETGTVLLDTDDIPEGVTNLYFTNARASAAAPVQSVNGETGVVSLSAADVGADAAGTAAAAVAAHVADTTPHDVITQIDRAGFDTTAGLTAGVGELVWNATDGTLDLGLPGGVTLQTGQEFLVRGLNNSGTTMLNAQAVYISGASGNRVVFTRAQANVVIAERTIGILTQDIANNQEGFCTLAGLVRNINTSGWAEGSPLWLSATTAGAITDITPASPNRSILVGYVVRSHSTQGSIFVRVNSTGSLAALHDVNVIAPQNNDILVYNAASSTWLNQPNTGGSGEANTASNLGAGNGVFAQKVGVDLQFKSLVAGSGITLTPTASTITITGSGGGGSVTSVNGQTGVVVLTTTDINEGTNLYFTNARASAAAPVQTVDGQTGTVNLTGSYAPLSHVGSGGTSHANATTSVAGFMSAADKTKLDGVATNANNYVHPNHSGDVTSVGDGAQTIAANAVTNAKAADMAVNTIKGRITTGTGDPEDLTAAQVRTIINVANGATANSTDATLLARANHTGTQTASTISDFNSAARAQTEAELVAGTNVTITPSGSGATRQLTIAATGGWDTVLTPAIASGVLTIDLAVPAYYKVTLNANVTSIVFSNYPSSRAPVFVIEFAQDATGGRTVTWPGSVQADDGGSIPAVASAANAVTVYSLSTTDGTTYKLYSGTDNGFTVVTGAVNHAPLTTIASAATTNIGAELANTINVSGTTTITSFGTITAGAERTLVFSGALILTHNATSLILPTAANITTAAGDTARMVSLGGGNWKCLSYQRANGDTLGLGTAATATVVTSVNTATNSEVLNGAYRGLNTNFFKVVGNAMGATNIAGVSFYESDGSTRSGFIGDASSVTTSVSIVVDDATNGFIDFRPQAGTNSWQMTSSAFHPQTDNTKSIGTASLRNSVIYAGTGTINTSDGRTKTEVRDLSSSELAAAKDLAKEFGAFKFLASIAAKGDEARWHIGMTVQRAIEIMESHGLDPMAYGFICYDAWDAFDVEITPAKYEEQQVGVDENEQPIVEWVETAPAVVEHHPAADLYSFRPDQLLLFIAAGFEARLSALEAM